MNNKENNLKEYTLKKIIPIIAKVFFMSLFIRLILCLFLMVQSKCFFLIYARLLTFFKIFHVIP